MKIPDGWTLISTGGNCDAWEYPLPDSRYALLTQAGDPCAPFRIRQRVVLGVYGREGRQLIAMEFASVTLALKAFNAISFIEETEI